MTDLLSAFVLFDIFLHRFCCMLLLMLLLLLQLLLIMILLLLYYAVCAFFHFHLGCVRILLVLFFLLSTGFICNIKFQFLLFLYSANELENMCPFHQRLNVNFFFFFHFECCNLGCGRIKYTWELLQTIFYQIHFLIGYASIVARTVNTARTVQIGILSLREHLHWAMHYNYDKLLSL